MRGRPGWQSYHTVWALVVLGWVGNYVVRTALAPLLPAIMGEFRLTHAQAGLLFSVFFYGYIAMQVPAGLLGDRYGRKRVLVGGILLVAGASLLTGAAATLAVLVLARLLTGLAQGMYYANDRPIIAAVTPPHRLAVGQGVSFCGLGLGTTLGVLAGGALGERLPWRTVFLLLAALPLFSAILVGRFVPDPTARWPGATARVAAGVAFRHRPLWVLALAANGPIWSQWLLGTWGPGLFAEVGVQDLGRSALYASLLGLAAPPGLFAVGLLSDRLRARGIGRASVIAGGLVVLAVLMAAVGLAVQARSPAWGLALLVFLASLLVWGVWAPTQAMVAEMMPREVQGVAFGLLNGTAFAASLVAPGVSGWLKDQSGSFAGSCYVAAVVALAAVPVALAARPSAPPRGRAPA